MPASTLVRICCCAFLAFCPALHASTASPLPTPQIFAPGVISGPASDGSPTFSPDGNTLFFTRSAARWSIILESRRTAGVWAEPKIASFSGTWSDSSPAMSPDGAFIVFVSTRPLVPLPGEKSSPGATTSHLWRVSRAGTGWSEPVELPKAVNFCQYLFRPSVAADSSVYFTAAGQGKQMRLFRSLFKNGEYTAAAALPFSDGNTKDVDPEIAPDQSFLIFTSLGRSGDGVHEKLFITYNKAGVWSEVMPIHYVGDDQNGSSDDNDPRLGPGLGEAEGNNRHTLYFSSDRSAPTQFPRTPGQIGDAFARLQSWDNGNPNIWCIPLNL